MRACKIEALLGKKVLIKGDVNSGKTRFTEGLLRQAAALGLTGEITVIDMAPDLVHFKGKLIGGKMGLPPASPPIKYLTDQGIAAPRIQGRSKGEVLEMARSNSEKISSLLGRFLKGATRMLIINDSSIFLHAGDYELLLSAIKAAETCILNAYSGKALLDDKGSGISEREAELLDKLEKEMDIVIVL